LARWIESKVLYELSEAGITTVGAFLMIELVKDQSSHKESNLHFASSNIQIGLSGFHTYKPELVKQEIWERMTADNLT